MARRIVHLLPIALVRGRSGGLRDVGAVALLHARLDGDGGRRAGCALRRRRRAGHGPGLGRPAAVRGPGRAEPRRDRRVQPLGRAARRRHRPRRRRRPRRAARDAARGHGAARELRSGLSGDDRRPALRVDRRARRCSSRRCGSCARSAGGETRSGRTVAREAVAGRRASTRSPPRTAARSRR